MPHQHQYKFELLPEFFVDYYQVAAQSPNLKVTTQPSFGIIDREYEYQDVEAGAKKPWGRLRRHVEKLNRDSPDHVSYKVVFLTRHGRGYHNAQESLVGTEAWDNHWALLEGTTYPNGTSVVWADAHLLEEGIQQAKELSTLWLKSLSEDTIIPPATIYTSPLARCLETTKLSLSELAAQTGLEFRPIVKELLRERLTDHTCDRRSPRSWIASAYPEYVIEEGFSEEDLLWRADRFETDAEHFVRKQKVMEDIWATDGTDCVSLTVHSYAIASILAVCGAKPFMVREGSTIALLVRGERLELPN